jgi:hypothetical protein
MLKEKEFQRLLLDYFKERKIEAIAEYTPPQIFINTKDRVDIFLPSKNTIIEIKRASKFKDAIGQVETYCKYLVLAKLPEPKKVICLFGHTTQSQSDTIRKVCNESNITLLYFKLNIQLKNITSNELLWQTG